MSFPRWELSIQRFVVRTARSPLRIVWRLAYAAAQRALTRYLMAGHPEATVFVCGGYGAREAVYGISDIDLVVVLPEHPRGPGVNRMAMRRRWSRLSRRLAVVDRLLHVGVHEQAGLEAAASATTLTYGVEPAGLQAQASRALYFGPAPSILIGGVGLLEGPGLFGPMSDWRHLAGPARLPTPAPHDAQDRRVAAWLSLQSWWRWAFSAVLNPSGPRAAYACVKLISEPVRMWLALTHGLDRRLGRTEVLERALRLMPAHEHAIRGALELHASLTRSPPAPLAEVLPWFVALSCDLAARISAEASAAGATTVSLTWDERDHLLLPRPDPALRPGEDAVTGSGELLPLADWRALVMSELPDEAFSVVNGDPGDPAALADAARAADESSYRALRASNLLVLPTSQLWERGRLRAVQCPASDPVSFALAAGGRSAGFPEARGWSARDWARRAVAEHRAWLAHPAGGGGEALARLLNAARAALFLESLGGKPELTLTAAATAERLGARREPDRAVADEACGRYADWRLQGEEPPVETVRALAGAVRRLPSYADDH